MKKLQRCFTSVPLLAIALTNTSVVAKDDNPYNWKLFSAAYSSLSIKDNDELAPTGFAFNASLPISEYFFILADYSSTSDTLRFSSPGVDVSAKYSVSTYGLGYGVKLTLDAGFALFATGSYLLSTQEKSLSGASVNSIPIADRSNSFEGNGVRYSAGVAKAFTDALQVKVTYQTSKIELSDYVDELVIAGDYTLMNDFGVHVAFLMSDDILTSNIGLSYRF